MLTGALRKQWENVQDFPNLACQQVLRWAGMAFCHLQSDRWLDTMQALTADVIRTVKSPHGPACTLAFLFLFFSRVQMSIYLLALRFSRRILQGGFFQVAANFKSVSNSSIYTHWALQGGWTPFCVQNRFNFSCHGFISKILIHVGTFAADAAV